MLDCSSRGLGSRLKKSLCFFFLGQNTLFSQCLSSTQEYNWVPAKIAGKSGVNLVMEWLPHPGGGSNIPSCFMLWKLEKALARLAT